MSPLPSSTRQPLVVEQQPPALGHRLAQSDAGVVRCACGKHAIRLWSTPEYAGGRATGERNYYAVCSCGSAKERCMPFTAYEAVCDTCAEWAHGRQVYLRFVQSQAALGARREVLG